MSLSGDPRHSPFLKKGEAQNVLAGEVQGVLGAYPEINTLVKPSHLKKGE